MADVTEEQMMLEEVRAYLATLPADTQSDVSLLAGRLRGIMQNNSEHGPLALALVGAELACMGETLGTGFPPVSLPNLPRC